MVDGSITFSTELDNKELEKQLNSLTKKVDSIEDKLSQKRAERLPLVQEAEKLGVQLDAAKAKLYEMQTASNGAFSPTQIQDQQIRVNGLQAEWNGVQGRVERYDAAINRATIELNRNKERAGAVAGQIRRTSVDTEKMSAAVRRAGDNMNRFRLRLASVVRSALVFVVITQALAKLREWMGNVIKASPEATAAIAQLKGALLTMAQPLVNVIIPAFVKFVQVLTQVITVVAKFIAMLFNTTLAESAAAAGSLSDEIEGVGSAAEEATKALAPFDEIQQISGGGSSGSGGGSGSSTISPDFSSLVGMDTEEYKRKVDEITVYVSGALLALGTILAFSGANIPLGLGLMALGAIGLASEIKEHWNELDGRVKQAIDAVLLALGGAELVIGAILALSGANTALGIGLMIVGAASLATAAALNWDRIPEETRDTISTMLIILGGSMLALGAILAFTGVGVALGVKLMVMGAATLATAAVLNWDKLPNDIRGVATKILLIAGATAIVIGIILAFTGVALPLGIGLIASGAGALGTAAYLNWDAILENLQQSWANIKAWWNRDVANFFTFGFWRDQFQALREVLPESTKAGINQAIAQYNRFIDWINSHLRITWPEFRLAGKLIWSGGSIQLSNFPRMPYLAQGAVIPPNREFMAVLGDQKSGNNIEAPESLIRRIVREETGGVGGKPITVILEMNRREFARVVYDANNDETQRVGMRFAT